MEKKQGQESDESGETVSWMSHSYGTAAAAVAASSGICVPPSPPLSRFASTASTAANAVPIPVAGECNVARVTQLFLPPPLLTLLPPPMTPPFGPGSPVGGAGGDVGGVLGDKGKSNVGSTASGEGGHRAAAATNSSSSPYSGAVSRGGRLSTPVSTGGDDDTSPGNSGHTLHYESTFVELVRGQIERFGESYKRWKLEMEEEKSAREADLRSAHYRANSAVQCAESAVSMAAIATSDLALSYGSSQHSDIRSSYNETVEYYENYSYSVVNEEEMTDPCSCYRTYTNVREQHDRLNQEQSNRTPPPKYLPEPYSKQDNKYLPMEELTPTEWVYINPYLCNFPSQKGMIESTFSCYGEESEQNYDVREEYAKERKWFQMPVKEFEKLRQSIEGGLQTIQPSSEYQADVQSEVDNYLEWRNGGQENMNFPHNPSEQGMWPQMVHRGGSVPLENLALCKRHTSSFFDTRDESLFLSPVKEESAEEPTTSTDKLVNKVEEDSDVPVHDASINEDYDRSDMKMIKKDEGNNIQNSLTDFQYNNNNDNNGENFTPESKPIERKPSSRENRKEMIISSISVKDEISSPQSEPFTPRQLERSGINTDTKTKDLLCEHKSRNNVVPSLSLNKGRKKKPTIYCPKAKEQDFEEGKHIKYPKHSGSENIPHSTCGNEKQESQFHTGLQETKKAQEKEKVHKYETGNNYQQSCVQRNMSKGQVDVSFTERQLYSTIRENIVHKHKKKEKQPDKDFIKHSRYSSSCSNVQKKPSNKLHSKWYEKPAQGEHTETFISGSRGSHEREHTTVTSLEKRNTRKFASNMSVGKIEEYNKTRRLSKREKSKLPVRKQNKTPSIYNGSSYCQRYKTSSTDAESSQLQNKVRIKKYSKISEVKVNSNQKYKKEQHPSTKSNSKTNVSVMYFRGTNISIKSVSSEEYPSSSVSENEESDVQRQSHSTLTSSDPKTSESKSCVTEVFQQQQDNSSRSTSQNAILQSSNSRTPESSNHYLTTKNLKDVTPVCENQSEPLELSKAVSISSNDSDNDHTHEENTVIYRAEGTQKSSVSNGIHHLNTTSKNLDSQNKDEKYLEEENRKEISDLITRNVFSNKEIEFWCPGAYIQKENLQENGGDVMPYVGTVQGIQTPRPSFRTLNDEYESLQQHREEAMKFTISASLATAEIQSLQAFQHNEMYEYKLISDIELQPKEKKNQEPYKVIYIPVTSSQKSFDQESTKLKEMYLSLENSGTDQMMQGIDENFAVREDNEDLVQVENRGEGNSSERKSANREEDSDRVMFIESSQNKINNSRSQNWDSHKETESYVEFKVYEERDETANCVETNFTIKEIESENIAEKFNFEYNIPISRSRENMSPLQITEFDSDANDIEYKEENYFVINEAISEGNYNSDNSSCSSPNTIISVITIIDQDNNIQSTDDKLLISEVNEKCYEPEEHINLEGCYLDNEKFENELEGGKDNSEYLSDTEILLKEDRDETSDGCAMSNEEEETSSPNSQDQNVLNLNTEDKNHELQEELEKHSPSLENSVYGEVGFSITTQMNAESMQLQGMGEEELRQLSIAEEKNKRESTDSKHENKTCDVIICQTYNQNTEGNYDSDKGKDKEKSKVIEVESVYQKELPIKTLRSASSDLMAKKGNHYFLPTKLHYKYGPRRKTKSLQEPCKSSSSIMWNSKFVKKSVVHRVPSQKLGKQNKQRQMEPRRNISNAGFEFTLVDSKEDNNGQELNISHNSIDLKTQLNIRKNYPNFSSRNEPLPSHFSNDNSNQANLFNFRLFNKFSIGDQIASETREKSLLIPESVSQKTTMTTATQTDYGLINISPISLQEERKYNFQFNESKGGQLYGDTTNIKNRMKEVLVHIAKHLLKNDIKRLVQTHTSHEKSYTENNITLENIPFKKIQELKDMARKFLSNELKDWYSKQYRMPPSPETSENLESQRKVIQISPHKIDSLKQITRQILMKKLAKRLKKPSKQLQTQISKVKHILRQKARKIFNEEIFLLCDNHKKKLRSNRGRKKSKKSKISHFKNFDTFHKTKKNIESHKLKHGILKNKEKKKVTKKIKKIKNKLCNLDFKLIVRKKDFRGKQMSKLKNRKGCKLSYEETKNAKVYPHSSKCVAAENIHFRRNVPQHTCPHQLMPPPPPSIFPTSKKLCSDPISMSAKRDGNSAPPLSKIPSFLYTKMHGPPPYLAGSADGKYSLHQNYVIAYMPHVQTNSPFQHSHSLQSAPNPLSYDDFEEPGCSTTQSMYVSAGERIFVYFPGEESLHRMRKPLHPSNNFVFSPSHNQDDELPFITHERIYEDAQFPSHERGRGGHRKPWNSQYGKLLNNGQGTCWHLPYRGCRDTEYGDIAYNSDFNNSSPSDLSMWSTSSSDTDESDEYRVGILWQNKYFCSSRSQKIFPDMPLFNNQVPDNQKHHKNQPSQKISTEYNQTSLHADFMQIPLIPFSNCQSFNHEKINKKLDPYTIKLSSESHPPCNYNKYKQNRNISPSVPSKIKHRPPSNDCLRTINTEIDETVKSKFTTNSRKPIQICEHVMDISPKELKEQVRLSTQHYLPPDTDSQSEGDWLGKKYWDKPTKDQLKQRVKKITRKSKMDVRSTCRKKLKQVLSKNNSEKEVTVKVSNYRRKGAHGDGVPQVTQDPMLETSARKMMDGYHGKKKIALTSNKCSKQKSKLKTKLKPKRIPLEEDFETTSLIKYTATSQRHKNKMIFLWKVLNTMLVNMILTRLKKNAYVLKSARFWRTTICLVSLVSLPFLMYLGSILSLSLCNTKPCGNNWPNLCSHSWCSLSSYPHETVRHSFF